MFDFDGVLSDGRVITLSDGDQLRSTNVKDGYALQLALKKGLRVVVLSGGYSESMKKRYATFEGMEILLGVSNKIQRFREYLAANNISAEEVLYMGDDIPDYEVMSEVGLSACPADAAVEIKNMADYISFAGGGQGCVRDVIEQVLRAQDKWFNEGCFHW